MKLTRIPAHVIIACLLVIIPPGLADERSPVFESEIQPVLARKCGKCHSERVQKGGLDLSSIVAIRHGGESGTSAVQEDVSDSLLWIMIDSGEMPPADQTQLTMDERELIHRWIVAGSPSEKTAQKNITRHDVLPILLLRCTACHGARQMQGGLDLRTMSSIRHGGNNGPALVPGNPNASLMIRRIESEACPPRELLLKFFVKRPPLSEVEILRDWIADGAVEADLVPDVATTEPDPLVSDEDRQHWAFRPPVPVPHHVTVDDFVMNKLAESSLLFSPAADRDTLIRRAYLDLIGMPADLSEWTNWHNSDDPDWYRTMIDHLLASPHYGERWGRYWLDVAGYADSEGGVSHDPVRETAWKYRDYVIRAFNNDKPYNRFLQEQIAGDELLDYETAAVVTDEMIENLTATGFLRMGIDQTGSRTMNFVPERLGVINDVITVVGSGVMGLTLECARCHSHKYDAIPQRDYYRLKAIFQGALDEHDWLSVSNRSLKIGTPEHRQRVAEMNPLLQAELRKLEALLTRAITEMQTETLRHHYPDQTDRDRQTTLAALKTADNSRTLLQRTLVEKLQKAEVLPDSQQPEAVLAARRLVSDFQEQIEQVRQRMEPSLEIRALWDRGEPSPTYILRRGEYDKPGDLVGPGVPSVLTDGQTPFRVEPPFPDGTRKTGRRLALARWLTQPDHPLTARVMVNRIWYHHFGTGLVRSLENFGVNGEQPSHPELLDWLAIEFVKSGWSIKSLHRLIMNSRTYQQSNFVSDAANTLDPQNHLLSRMPLRRMDAETLRDTLLFVSGRLNDQSGGLPDSVIVNRDGLVSVKPSADRRWRRSIYVQLRRTEIPSMLEAFDYPEMGPNCLTRSVSVVSPQALLMINNDHVRELAAAFAHRVQSIVDESSPCDPDRCAAQIDTVYKLALNRQPSDEESRVSIEALHTLKTEWQGDEHVALTTYCHIILNSASFLYID